MKKKGKKFLMKKNCVRKKLCRGGKIKNIGKIVEFYRK